MDQTITLKDKRYSIIGYVIVKDNGNKILKDKRYSILGYYDKKRDVTMDKRYFVIAHGDVLTTLLNVDL